MKRFVLLVAVAAVAGVMYVAAAPGSSRSQASGPTTAQFRALKAQVATLAKKVKAARSDLDGLAAAYLTCSLHSEVGVSQRSGYATSTTPTTALDLASTAPAYELTPFNTSEPACGQLIGLALHRNAAARLAHQFGH